MWQQIRSNQECDYIDIYIQKKKKRYDRDIVPNVRMAVVDRRVGLIVVAGERSGGARSDDAFAAAGEKVGIADFSEGISVVDVD